MKTAITRTRRIHGRSHARMTGTLGLILLTLFLPDFLHAHLSIIRQGAESSGSPEAGDRMGAAVVAGDFNGDGYEDLATGAPFENIGAGVVIISFGSYYGLTHVGAFHLFEGDVGGTTAASHEFGSALVAADFNADGIDDLAVGSPGAEVSGHASAGKVYILKGSAGGPAGWLVLTQNLLPGQSAESGDRFGTSLVAADFDQDPTGYDDLVVGSPGENGDAGVIMQFRSAAGGVGFGGMSWFDEATLGGTNAAGNRFGYALAAGNVVQGTEPDLVVSAPWYDDYLGQQDIGRIYVMKGLTGVGATQADATFYQANYCDHATTTGRFGTSLAVGYFRYNDEGYSCVAASEPNAYYWDSGADFYYDGAGRVLILAGGAAELDTATFEELYKADWTPVLVENEHFGSALTAGPFNGDDGYDDLVIGSPNDAAWDPRAGGYVDNGCIYVGVGSLTGIWSGPDFILYSGYHLNDKMESGDEIGAALCLGRWCEDGRYGIAVGAPGEDDDAGQVHIIAPWRQTFGLACRTALAVDCNDNYIYSLKPFEQVYIASTTKTMTVLLAAERSQLNPGNPYYVGLDETYNVPAWACYIPGSKFGFGIGEQMSLGDLMYACLLRSGNDAAHAIADMFHGPGDENVTVPAFVAEMNAKAAALGMNDTHFHNPAGLDFEAVGPDLGEHYSTAADMMKLSRAAMNNPLFAEVAGTVNHNIVRVYMPFDIPVEVPWTIHNIYGGVLQNSAQEMCGIKGGDTPKAQNTGLYAAEDGAGQMSLVGTFYTPADFKGAESLPNAISLMTLAMTGCGYELMATSGNDVCSLILPSIWSQIGQRQGGGREVPDRGDDQAVSLYRFDDGADFANVRLLMSRTSEVVVEDGDDLDLGITNFDSHDGIFFTNMGEAPVQFLVEYDYGRGGTVAFDLEPRERGTLEAYDSAAAGKSAVSIVLSNTTGEPACLGIEELYRSEVSVPPVDGGDFIVWQTQFDGDNAFMAVGIDVVVEGTDPTPVAHVRVVLDDPRYPTGVIQEQTPLSTGVSMRLSPAWPNPFSGETHIAFELFTGGVVKVRFFDLRGRLVRTLPSGRFAVGRNVICWDGRNEKARPLAKGVYFYEVSLDGRALGSGKVLLLR